MTDHELETLLAEYLAGEADADGAARLEALLHSDPALATRVAELRAAQEALLGGVPSLEVAEHRVSALRAAAVLPAPVAALRRSWLSAAARYAALIAIAFIAGYWARGTSDERVTSEPRPPSIVAGSGEHLAQRYVSAAQSHPSASAFARVLLTVARR